MENKIITKVLYTENIDTYLDRYSTDNGFSIKELTEKFKECEQKAKKAFPEFTTIRLSFGYEYGYYNECEYTISVIGQRLESNEELAARIEIANKKSEAGKKSIIIKKEIQEKKEKALLQKLLKKYEINE